MKKCHHCGKENTDDAAFCINCGTKLNVHKIAQFSDDNSYNAEETKLASINKGQLLGWKNIIPGISGGIILIIIAFVMRNMFSDPEAAQMKPFSLLFLIPFFLVIAVPNIKPLIKRQGNIAIPLVSLGISVAAVVAAILVVLL